MIAEGFVRRRRTPAEPCGEERKGERRHVRQHVTGISEQGERTRVETAKSFGDCVGCGQGEHNREASPPSIVHAMMMMVMMTVGVRRVPVRVVGAR